MSTRLTCACIWYTGNSVCFSEPRDRRLMSSWFGDLAASVPCFLALVYLLVTSWVCKPFSSLLPRNDCQVCDCITTAEYHSCPAYSESGFLHHTASWGNLCCLLIIFLEAWDSFCSDLDGTSIWHLALPWWWFLCPMVVFWSVWQDLCHRLMYIQQVMQSIGYLKVTLGYLSISYFHFTAVPFLKWLWPTWAAVGMSDGCPEEQCAAVTLGCSQECCPSVAEHFLAQQSWALQCSCCTAGWLWPFSSHHCRLPSL